MKQRGEKIAMLTAYDFSMAKVIDAAGMDLILIGDSASNVMAGNQTTLSITLDQMIYHASCVAKGVSHAMVICDMPFGTCSDPREAVHAAVRIMRESGVEAVKIEGGEEILDCIKAILHTGIPVMGHLGLTPQSVHQFGGYGLRCKDVDEAEKLVRDAHLLTEAGCFAIVLEKVPAVLAARIASEIPVPVIGIGAGHDVDGQVLVMHDMLGLNKGFQPKFLRRYADLDAVITQAVSRYIQDVKDVSFPNDNEQY